ncbi:helix-turn-helix domain-containing protein [Actinokineospora cianjurensis]|uniref:Helix-turn-helix protein n=1 Tax=Actinokineospora cianjurensis TaxID=585224 RepID=A0A421B1Y8_9PSEU|nr:helix-turn-helix transcriptional regulator [Actinokineospora cianjurensis]RLK58380.1 helix-turn-helix protein [Actinokineospora cianjurensis]
MPDREDPFAVQWLVGVELTRLRKQARRTVTEAAQAIGCSVGKISHMEAGRNQQRPDEVTTLLRLYGADQADVDRLASLAGSAGQKMWWAPWTDVVPDWLRTYVGLEGLACDAHWYSPLVLPAMLQTQQYSHGVTAGNIRVSPDHGDRVVRLRMERQQRLFHGDPPLRVTALLEEAVLQRPIGGSTVMLEQLRRLVELADRDNVDLRILPTALGAHDGLVTPFSVLHFTAAQPIAYVEVVNGALYVQDQDQVAGYTRTVERLRQAALSPADSINAIRSHLDAVT